MLSYNLFSIWLLHTETIETFNYNFIILKSNFYISNMFLNIIHLQLSRLISIFNMLDVNNEKDMKY